MPMQKKKSHRKKDFIMKLPFGSNILFVCRKVADYVWLVYISSEHVYFTSYVTPTQPPKKTQKTVQTKL